MNARTDLARLAQSFARDGRVVVPDVLEASFAARLHQRISTWNEWALVTRIEGRHRAFDAAAMESIGNDKRAAFDALVEHEARAGFQYLYERHALYDAGRAGRITDPVLLEAFGNLRSPAFLDLARAVCADPDIRFADGQVTRYRRGHFLTLHDDEAVGLNRRAAFVLNLTRGWAPDFGGQLQFVDREGQVEASVTPTFNAMTVFAVPRPHLVSQVAAFVPDSRYAITGWFRAGEEPLAGQATS